MCVCSSQYKLVSGHYLIATSSALNDDTWSMFVKTRSMKLFVRFTILVGSLSIA